MKNTIRGICILLMLLFATACGSVQSNNANDYVNTEEDVAENTFLYSPAETEYINYAEEYSSAYTSSDEKSSSASITEETAETDIFSAEHVQIDLNYDGIPENFFIGDNVYEIKLYTDRSSLGYHSFTLPRVESIDIYRRPYNDSSDKFAYSFSCVFGNNKHIAVHLVYTGCESDKCISGMGYGESLVPCISYREWFSTMLQEEFEKLIKDPKVYFKPEWEYVQTLNLEEMANIDCTQRYSQNIRINDYIDEIQMFSLENDIFGKEIKLSNDKYSVYVSYFDCIEVYERTAIMEVPTDEYHVYNYTPRNEKDYLLCLKSSGSENTECVYLGTAEESYLFLYNLNYNNGFSVENADSLNKDGWQYVRSITI